MKISANRRGVVVLLALFVVSGFGLAACTARSSNGETAVPTLPETSMLTLPEVTAVELHDEPLRVVATTSIIGDVVAQVGGEAIALTVLMAAGQDPHSFEPGAQTYTAGADAHVIFVNGWDLEEALVHDLQTVAEGVPLVPVSAQIAPLPFGAGASEHNGPDPHTWQSVHNVTQWVHNIEQTLTTLDPAHSAVYERNATTYLAELAQLDEYARTQLALIPAAKRVLITNHDSLAYFAHDYDFEILDTVIPGGSTLAEASANDLAMLIQVMSENGVCTIFSENSSSATFAQAAAAELEGCDDVQVVPLYTDALGPAGSDADSYIGMIRANVQAIVARVGE